MAPAKIKECRKDVALYATTDSGYRTRPTRNLTQYALTITTIALGLTSVGLARAEESGLDLLKDAHNEQSSQEEDLKKEAESGNPNFQYALGTYYNAGGNYANAFHWYKLAAAKGHSDAQTALGSLFSSGLGVAQNFTEAARWFKKAAEQGNTSAQSFLGFAYAKGETGGPQNNVEAYFWLNLAVARGDEHGQKVRDMLARELSPSALARVQKRCEKWMVAFEKKQAKKQK